MPEENQKKNKNEPREQRRKRQNRHPPGPVDKKVEKEAETPKVSGAEKTPPKVTEPPPEFYQNLKRETDEILKITEEANSKYKKKEIKSNWAKYEMPIESYEEIDEQESIGADFESLIQASLSVGGHFQFKHEKSWDHTSGPSPYDKYFVINMENLSLALSTIPFFERNNIDLSLFSEADIQNMNHRATKFKQKYYTNKKIVTPESDAESKILMKLSEKEQYETDKKEIRNSKNPHINLENRINEDLNDNIEKRLEETDKDVPRKLNNKSNEDDGLEFNKETLEDKMRIINEEEIENLDDSLLKEENVEKQEVIMKQPHEVESIKAREVITTPADTSSVRSVESASPSLKETETDQLEKQKNPIIESPEDLEKWLDDFLDG